VGVGGFAEGRAREALEGSAALPGRPSLPAIGCILHPSPASPAANRDWAGQMERQLRALGVALPQRREEA
jgi:single-strand selective monofunctional uracil DNA glycosylase